VSLIFSLSSQGKNEDQSALSSLQHVNLLLQLCGLFTEKQKQEKKETNNYRQLSFIPALVFLFAVILMSHNVATAFLCKSNVEVLSLIYLIYES